MLCWCRLLHASAFLWMPAAWLLAAKDGATGAKREARCRGVAGACLLACRVAAMHNAGAELEGLPGMARWGLDAARALLLQVALALAVAEDAYQFEHRDLHSSNVLVAPAPAAHAEFRLKGRHIRVATHGVQPTIIDFTLSRLVAMDGSVAFFDLEADPEVFQGTKGHPQVGTRDAL